MTITRSCSYFGYYFNCDYKLRVELVLFPEILQKGDLSLSKMEFFAAINEIGRAFNRVFEYWIQPSSAYHN